MRFALAYYLHALWVLPVVAYVLHVLHQRREKLMARFVQGHLLPKDLKQRSKSFWQRKAIALVIALLCAIVALARPQWGYHTEDVKRQGVDILLAVDVSKSMLTQDVKPSRLERTKLAVKDMLKQLKGDRVGLIAFAGDAFLVCPLTNDYQGFLLSLNDLGPDTIPRGGTNISSAITEAIRSYGKSQAKDRVLVIATDGEDLEGNISSAVREAKSKGIRIYTTGIGTVEGDLIQVPGADGAQQFLKDSQGNYVKSRLNENVLQKIAYDTGGAYARSSGAQFGLDYLYEQQISALQKSDFDNRQEKKYHERFQWFLGVCLLSLLA